MNNKLVVVGLAVLAIVFGGLYFANPTHVVVDVKSPPLGAAVNNEHYNQEYFYGGVNTGPFNSGYTFTSRENCAVSAWRGPALAGGASSTIGFSLPGVSTTTNQVYTFGIASSSNGWESIQFLSAGISSTVNGIDAFVRNNTTGTTFAARTTNVQATLCFRQVATSTAAIQAP